MNIIKEFLRNYGDAQGGVPDSSVAMRNLMKNMDRNKSIERGVFDGIQSENTGIPDITLSPVMRRIMEDRIIGASGGLRLGYDPEGLGAGATLGAEITAGPDGVRTGPIRGLDIQHKSGDQQMGVGVLQGDRGNRWGIQYRNKF